MANRSHESIKIKFNQNKTKHIKLCAYFMGYTVPAHRVWFVD